MTIEDMRIYVKKFLGSKYWRDAVDDMDEDELKTTYRKITGDYYKKKENPRPRYEQMKFDLEAIS